MVFCLVIGIIELPEDVDAREVFVCSIETAMLRLCCAV